VRNWLHAQDTANAVITVIDSGVQNEIYNICGNFEQDNLTTVQKIIKLHNGDEKYLDYLDLTTVRPGMDMRYALDDTKLQNLGWQPTAIFDEKLEEIVQFYKDNFIW
jgi:dTDP-glucose 4,6-dehydratase